MISGFFVVNSPNPPSLPANARDERYAKNDTDVHDGGITMDRESNPRLP